MSNSEPMENNQHPVEQNSAHAAQTAPILAPASLLTTVLQQLGLNGTQPPVVNVERLRNALHHRDWFVRAGAVRTLGQLGSLASLEPLLTALSDEHVSVRVTAVHALTNFGSRMPVERLVAALHDEEWQVRDAVVFALGELGSQAPREPLMIASRDSDIAVRAAAQQVLQQNNKNTTIKRGPMRETDFQTDEYRPSSREKLPVRTLRRKTLWRRVGISAAVVFVVLNVVAWTVLVQHLRPSHSTTVVGSGPHGTPTLTRPKATSTPQSSGIVGQTLYTYRSMDGIAPLAWSPDGTRLGSVTIGTTAQDCCTGISVNTRDAKTGKNIFTYEKLGASALSIGWSLDGTRFQASSQTVKVWDVTTGRLLVEYQPKLMVSAMVPSTHANPQAQANPQSGGNMIYSSSWSPDGKLIASAVNGNAYGFEVQVWNAQTGNLAYQLQPNANPTPSDYISQVSWSPDGKYIALTVDGNVQVWSVATKSIVTKYSGGSFAWSPDGKDIVSTEGNGTVQVWTALTGKTIYTYNGHVGQGNGGASTVAWSPDGKRIASGGSDVQVWNATTGGNVYVYSGHGKPQNTYIESIVWSPDSKYIASGDTVDTVGGHVRVWVAA